MSANPRSGRRMFWLLAFLFGAPVASAYLLYYAFPQWAPGGRTNYGVLHTPVRQLPEARLLDADGAPPAAHPLIGTWTLLYVARGPCGEDCRQRLVLGRQMRTALNEKRTRVQRVYLDAAPERLREVREQLAPEHPDLRWLTDPSASLAGSLPAEPDAYFLVDPRGNWVMTYPYVAGAARLQADFRGMQKDIKKLLKNTPP